jgi:hypothetical protein
MPLNSKENRNIPAHVITTMAPDMPVMRNSMGNLAAVPHWKLEEDREGGLSSGRYQEEQEGDY